MNDAMGNAVKRIYDKALPPRESLAEAWRAGFSYARSPEALKTMTDDVAEELGMPGHETANGHAMRLRLYHALKGAMASDE